MGNTYLSEGIIANEKNTAFMTGYTGTVCPMGHLVGVVAKARHLAQQVSMVGARTRVEFSAHDQRTQIFLTGQAA